MRFVVLAKRCTLSCFAQIPAEISCAFLFCFVFLAFEQQIRRPFESVGKWVCQGNYICLDEIFKNSQQSLRELLIAPDELSYYD